MANEKGAKPKAEKKDKPEQYEIRLVDGVGAELKLKAKASKDGKTAQSYMFHRPGKDGDGKRARGVRGATKVHGNFADAKAAIETYATEAQKGNWFRSVRVGGGQVDSFDLTSIPAGAPRG